MKTTIRGLVALNSHERRVFFRAWLYLLLVDIGLRLVSLQKLQTTIEVLHRPLRTAASILPERLVVLVGIAARHHLYPMCCLQRALTLQALLCRQGEWAKLQIGVKRGGDSLYAHAWVEWAGAPLGENLSIERRFLPLLTLRKRA